jgi:hypothetical protein
VYLRNGVFALLVGLAGLVVVVSAGEPPKVGRSAVSGSEEDEWRFDQETRIVKFGFEGRIVDAPRRAPISREWERYVTYTRSLRTPGEVGPAGREGVLVLRPPDAAQTVYYGRYPDYLKVEVMNRNSKLPRSVPDPAVYGENRSIRMQLSGTRDMDMVGVRRRVPMRVDPSFAYELGGWVRLESVKKPGTYARLRIEWLDAKRKFLSFSSSDPVNRHYLREQAALGKITSTTAWAPTPEFRVNEVDPRARFARVWCVASGREMGAYAYFDDLEIKRLPKVSALPAQAIPYGIFNKDETPALKLRFQGLELGSTTTAYRRLVRFQDIFGRGIGIGDKPNKEPLKGDFKLSPGDSNTIKEHVQLTGMDLPGVYAVEIVLQIRRQKKDGKWKYEEVAKRVTRIARMPSRGSSSTSARGELCAVELDLYHSESDRLIGAVKLCGIYTLGFPLWRLDSDASKFRSGTEDVKLDKRMRELTAAQMSLIGSFSPVPTGLRSAIKSREWAAGARTMYKAETYIWSPLVEATASYFHPYLSEWRMAAPDDRSFGGGELDRPVLAAKVRAMLQRAASKRVSVPVPFESLTVPAPRIGDGDYREHIYVPSSLSPEDFGKQLARLFPPPKKPETTKASGGINAAAGTASAPGAAGAKPKVIKSPYRPGAGRSWSLELVTVSENLGWNMKAEAGQVNDLARKFTLLAILGAERIHVKLADKSKGLLGPGLYPRPVFSAYSVLAEHLTGAKYLGEFDLTKGAQAYAFERGKEALVVFWTDGPRRKAACQLGASKDASLVELTGTELPLVRPSAGEPGADLDDARIVPLDRVPALLTGLEPAFIRTRLGFRLADDSRLETRYQLQTVSFEVRNYFEEPMQARIFPTFPRGSHTVPRFREVSVGPGKTSRVTFQVRPSFVETVGEKKMSVRLKLSSRTQDPVIFTLDRKISVESPIDLVHSLTEGTQVAGDEKTPIAEIQLQIKLSDDPRYAWVKVKREYGLDPAKAYDFDVYLVDPGGSRQRAQIRGVKSGESKRMDRSFVIPLGDKPRKIYAGARQHGGVWFTNVEIEIPAAKQKTETSTD